MDMPQPVVRENVVGRRIVAALIDVLILAVVFIIMSALFGDTETGRRETASGERTGVWVSLTGWPFVLYALIVLGYYLVLEATLRQTAGKLVMGLEVVSADGAPLTAGRVFLRTILRLVDGLPFLYLVGLITIAASKDQQRIGDMAAKTLVVRKALATSGAA
jgi:uncharacterized RDD family membrane protein YckC